MSHGCFIHSSADGHLGCFHILVTVNNAAMKQRVLMFFQISVLVTFRYIPRSAIAVSKADAFLIFSIYFIDYAIIVVPFPPFIPLYPAQPFLPAFSPLQLMPMSRTYNFFGFYISCTILKLPLSILYVPIMLIILGTFSTFLPDHH